MATIRFWMYVSVILTVKGVLSFEELEQFQELYDAFSADQLFHDHEDSEVEDLALKSTGVDFNCPASVSPETPTSVHQLRPGDIRIIGAVGDSLSTAYAARAPIFLPVMMNYWGVSASIGGDKDIHSIGTLPNVFKKYNPDLYGYSKGTGVVFTHPKKKNLNHAVVGATADKLPGQARKLINYFKDDSHVDMDNDWKLITLFIGGNDLCSGCQRAESDPAPFLGYIEETIQMLKDEVPRALVNLVGVLNAYMLPDLEGGLKCGVVHKIVCKCLTKSGGRDAIYARAKEYQKIVQEVIESGKFDDKEDFTVVYQPFFHNTEIPRKKNGKADASYFASDCFHLSQKGQAAQAVANWNGLFEPVGQKRLEWVPGEALQCPSEEFPYIYTNVNSKTTFQSAGAQPGSDHHLSAAGAAPTSDDQGLSSQTVIILCVAAGTLAGIVVVAVVVVRKRRTPNGSYQEL